MTLKYQRKGSIEDLTPMFKKRRIVLCVNTKQHDILILHRRNIYLITFFSRNGNRSNLSRGGRGQHTPDKHVNAPQLSLVIFPPYFTLPRPRICHKFVSVSAWYTDVTPACKSVETWHLSTLGSTKIYSHYTEGDIFSGFIGIFRSRLKKRVFVSATLIKPWLGYRLL